MSRKFLVFMTALALGGATLVTGCGGGGGGSTPPASSSVSVSGNVSDGYISGATIKVNGVPQPTLTGATGNYTVDVTGSSQITAEGGTDVANNKPFTGILIADFVSGVDSPEGLYVTPLTTLLHFAPTVFDAGAITKAQVKKLDIGNPNATGNNIQVARKAALAVQNIVATLKSATGNNLGSDTAERVRVAFSAVGAHLASNPLVNDSGETVVFDSADVREIAGNAKGLVDAAQANLVEAQINAASSIIETLTNEIQLLDSALSAAALQNAIEITRAAYQAQLDSIEQTPSVDSAEEIATVIAEQVQAKAAVLETNRARAAASLAYYSAQPVNGDTLEVDVASVRDSIEALIVANDTKETSEFDAIYGQANRLPRLVSALPAQTLVVGTAMTPLQLGSFFKDNGTLTYAVTSGSLPAGVALASGVISGTATAASAVSTVVITATDTSDKAVSGSVTFTVSATPVDPDPIDPADCAVDYPPVQGLPSDFYPPKVVEACYPDNLFPPTPGL
ncbi:Ig domain-containing protein [Chrysiogenes arsenatis]|uniref:Ig domain-containing protein n=1 Tax=Chrysiogenes arsenatis TaxID=309797 RepID=UPI00042484D8|nr:Ig domain-containing protein [Chrysiogenes arsenatis]